MPDPANRWSLAPPALELAADEVHVWRVSLEVEPSQLGRLRQLLDDQERDRGDRFRLAPVRRRFIVCRARLRQLLSSYQRVAPRELEFTYAELGKPELVGRRPAEPLYFNVSHSHELALIAVTRSGELGVDIERVRPLRDMRGLAQRFFAASEYQGLERLGPEAREAAFFRLWTRKEALLKATGKGLSFPLRDVVVSLEPGEAACVLRFGTEPAAGWSLFHLEPDVGYTAALARRARVGPLRQWLWPPDEHRGLT